VGGTFYMSGTLVFLGGTVGPDAAGLDIVDVWVNSTDSDLVLSSGVFNVTLTAESTVGSYVYNVTVVQDGAGAGGTDECHATHTDTYISDRVNVTLSLTYARRQVSLNVSDLLVSAVWEHDGLAYDGTVTLNDTDFAHSAAGTYGYRAASCSGGTHGLTAVLAENSVSTVFDFPNSTLTYYWQTTPQTTTLFIGLSPSMFATDEVKVDDLSYIWVYRNGTKYSKHYPLSGHWFTFPVSVPITWNNVNITILFSFTNSTFYFADYSVYSGVISTETAETTMYFVYRMADSTVILFETFLTYVDGNLLSPYTPFYVTTAATFNLTVTDVWGDVVYQNASLAVSERIDIVTTSYWLSMQNQQPWAMNITIEHNGRNQSYYLSPYSEAGPIIVYTGTYEAWWVRSDNGELIQHDEPFTISDDWQVFTPYLPPEADRGGGGLSLKDLLFYGGWLGIAVCGSIIISRVVYPEIKKKWEQA
jgi:hypothetical protein